MTATLQTILIEYSHVTYYSVSISLHLVGSEGDRGEWRQGVPELLLCAHELDEVVLRGLGPLEVYGGAVHHVRGHEEVAGLLIQPVLRGWVLLHGGRRRECGGK